MTLDLPKTTKALILSTAKKSPDDPLFEISVQERPISTLKENEVLVRIAAAAYNYRELWQRKNQYPGIADGSVMGADGAGVVIASGSTKPDDPIVGKRVFLVPMRGWKSDPRGPEEKFGIVGGGSNPPIGTFTEYVVVEREYVIEVPSHLSLEECAAWPVGGLTAWRAAFVKGHVTTGQNVLITGIGGGVAIICFQLCVAAGANVYVTSGDQAKIDKAITMGAKGGVIYKSETWGKELGELLKKNSPQSPLLDLVVDSAGGDINTKVNSIMRTGGIISCYGMTAAPKIGFSMREVIKNIEVKGSTMGSQKELEEATDFLAKHKIVPVIGKLIDGLENADEGFVAIQHASHIGKIVLRIRGFNEEPQKSAASSSSPKL